MIITLPWPPAALKPNRSRSGNWWEKSAAAKKYKADCGWIAASNKLPLPEGNIHLSITFIPKTNTGDLDNMLASVKNGLDGIAEAWNINDKRFRPITIDVGKADKMNARVEITIETL